MNEPVLLGVVALVLAAVALGVALRGWGRGTGRADRQLGDLRTRLDAMLDAQRDVPRALAEEGAIQARALADVRERLAQVAEATKQLETVGAAVGELREVLGIPKVRGTVGELWLEELLRQVLPAECYEREYRFRSGERVDAVIKLGDRMIPVDAKFPLEAYQRMQSLHGADQDRERRLFHRSVRARVDEIADKYIRPDEGTYEFALMYVPAETVYYESLLRAPERDDAVVPYAMARKVFVVSPHTFYAYLSALAHGLRGLTVEPRARELVATLAALERDIAALQETLALAGRHLGHAQRQYDDAARAAAEMGRRLDGFSRSNS